MPLFVRTLTSIAALALFGAACDPSPSPSGSVPWDAWTVHGPSALAIDNTLRLYYFATPGIQSFAADLGLATTPCAVSTAGGASCATPSPFVRTSPNPLGTNTGAALGQQGLASDPSVIFENGHYRLWFTSVELNQNSAAILSTAYSDSTDGVAWSVPTYHVLLPTPGTFDGTGVETPDVVRAGGVLYLFYTGDSLPSGEGSDRQAIGSATSVDGITWTKTSTTAIFDSEADWEQGVCPDTNCSFLVGGVGEPSVLYDTGSGQFSMWYAALGTRDNVETFRLGYASSPDGLNWTRSPDPILEPGDPGAWDDGGVSQPNVILDPTQGFHLFYFGFSSKEVDRCSQAGGCAFTRGSIGHAFSSDGVTWQRDTHPIFTPSG